MATEIELKAHVSDSEELHRILSKKAEPLGSFEKEDIYWFPEGNISNGLTGPFPSGLRVRREKRVFPDGRRNSATIATYKIKEVRGSIEVNDEKEFEVRPLSGQSDSVFEEFLSKAGFKPAMAKRKRGWVFYRDGITAELAEIDGLGWFVELEITADNNREETVSQNRKKLLDFLDSLGIEKGAIESRFYTEMLNKQQRTSKNPTGVPGNSQ